MNRLVIKNCMLYSGLGDKPYYAEILVEDEIIKKIAPLKSFDYNDAVVLDAKFNVVCPGFIDIHRHCDIKPFLDPFFADIIIAQGITSTIVGNCGISMTPVNSNAKIAEESYAFDEPVLGPAYPKIKDYQRYIHELERKDLPINMGAMIGTGNIKIAVKGFSNTPFSVDEMKTAHSLIEEALENGAPGISAGIMYIPECYTTKEEYITMLEPLSKFNGVFCTHIRGEGNSMVESIKEVIDIAQKAECSLEISHFKSCGMKNWNKDIHVAIKLIEDAQRSGVDVSCDFYPYEGGSTSLTTMLPLAFVNGDIGKALKKLGTPDGIEEFRRTSRKEYAGWDNYAITLGWDKILISGVVKEHNQKFIGKNLIEAAREFGAKDAVEMAAYLMHDEAGKTAIINMSMCQSDIDTVARLPYSIVISDSIYANTSTPHPRMYGAFPKIIREYVNERKILSLEEAIKKMTFLPAKKMGLKKRGELKEGYYADIIIFDPKKFKDNATFKSPTKIATGLNYVIINGNIVYEKDRIICRNAGKVIKNANNV